MSVCRFSCLKTIFENDSYTRIYPRLHFNLEILQFDSTKRKQPRFFVIHSVLQQYSFFYVKWSTYFQSLFPLEYDLILFRFFCLEIGFQLKAFNLLTCFSPCHIPFYFVRFLATQIATIAWAENRARRSSIFFVRFDNYDYKGEFVTGCFYEFVIS